LYHETGFLVLSSEILEHDFESFAGASYVNLLKRGYHPQRIDQQLFSAMFPAFNSEVYRDGFYNQFGGYVEAGRVIEELVHYARSMEITIHEGQTADRILISNHIATGVMTREGLQFDAGHVIVCAGNFTPYLLPELQPFMQITGHPVFHLKPESGSPFMPPDFSVFAADIQNTGWYGFPYHPLAQVVKVANHGIGVPVHPEKDERIVSKAQEAHLHDFLKISIPSLSDAPLVYTRLCCYTDTLDGHFWIDQHPEIKNLTVASGGSGHAFKMGPVLGEMIADTAEGGRNKWSSRYGWRELSDKTPYEEEARNVRR
jgi:glycine/D-amino acid oxidase-like deaminating enzyme